MWREFFFYNRGDKVAICCLSVVLALLLLFLAFRVEKGSTPSAGNNGDKQADSLLLAFNASIRQQTDSVRHRNYQPAQQRYTINRRKGKPYMEGRADTLRFRPAYKYPEGTVIDLNAADTTELKKIPGIGSAYARRIVRIREQLGGYYRVEQLQVHTYLTSEMNRWFKVETPHTRSILINSGGVDELNSHPYLSYSQAKYIVDYRHKYGKIKKLDVLLSSPLFAEDDITRLSPYIQF
ncbi:MAG: helix-hairpin-helix domain-containing protein [Bacteroidaceae bacterium]|nr:helix-hairpin-helix domain-containing protein [Bacteroidaceae bacterium]